MPQGKARRDRTTVLSAGCEQRCLMEIYLLIRSAERSDIQSVRSVDGITALPSLIGVSCLVALLHKGCLRGYFSLSLSLSLCLLSSGEIPPNAKYCDKLLCYVMIMGKKKASECTASSENVFKNSQEELP